MATYLDAILEHHRVRAAADTRRTDRLVEEASPMRTCRGFRRALVGDAPVGDAPVGDAPVGGDRLGVIAEVKRRSPSKGPLAADLDPADLAAAYQRGGARCLSVLTDATHFGGSTADLVLAHDAVELPVLRKDFTVSANDVCDTRLMGADCVLLIAAALDDAELGDFAALASEVGLDALVEIHDEAELERAMAVTDGSLIGVNQRDLVTFEVDRERAVRMAAAMSPATVRIAESGVRGADDARALAAAGFDAVLVGEHLVTSDDPAAGVAELSVPRLR